MGDIKIGNNSISKMFVGSSSVSSVWYGNNKIWGGSGSDIVFSGFSTGTLYPSAENQEASIQLTNQYINTIEWYDISLKYLDANNVEHTLTGRAKNYGYASDCVWVCNIYAAGSACCTLNDYLNNIWIHKPNTDGKIGLEWTNSSMRTCTVLEFRFTNVM